MFSDLGNLQGAWVGMESQCASWWKTTAYPLRRYASFRKTDKARKTLIAGMNEGQSGCCSTFNALVRVTPRNAVAIHHPGHAVALPDLEGERDARAVRKGNEVAKFHADNKVDVMIYAGGEVARQL